MFLEKKDKSTNMSNKNRKGGIPFFNMHFITTSISTMLVLLLLGLIVFFVLAANDLSTYVKENINLTVLLDDNSTSKEIQKTQNKLSQFEFVKQTTYISKEEAFKEHTEELGTDPIEFLGYNPFSPSIEVKLHAPYANRDSIEKVERIIKRLPHTSEIIYHKELIDMVNSNITKINIALLFLAGLFGLISFALIHTTIRLSIYSKRFIIHTMKLVGASWGFIRRPFLVKSIWGGLFAALLANATLLLSAYFLIRYNPSLSPLFRPQVLLAVGLSVFIFGITITLICSYISVSKFLRMRGDSIYYV